MSAPTSTEILISLLQQVSNSQSQIAASHAMLVEQARTAQSSVYAKEPKLPDVPMFNGSRSKCSTFLAQLENFFMGQPKSYDTDSKKVGYIIARLEGHAGS